MLLKKTIYIPIEVKVREFLPKIFFSFIASLNKYRVYIGSKEKIIKLIKQKDIKAGVFFYKGALIKSLSKEIKKKCDLFVVMDEEVTPNMSNYMHKMSNKEFLTYSIKNRLNHYMINNIDRYYNANYNIYLASKKVFKKNIYKSIPSGNFKIDLLRNENLKIYSGDVKKIKKKYKNFILFNSDFRYLHKRREFEDAFDLKLYKTIEKPKKFVSQEMSNINKFANYKYENFNFFLNLLKKNHKKLKKIKILIRPHPVEDINVWKKKIKNIKNVIVVPPVDDVIPYIIASKGVMHNGCTTSNASLVLNKPTAYVYEEKNNSNHKYLNKEKLKYCFKLSSDKDLLFWIKNHGKLGKISGKNKDALFKSVNLKKKTVSEIIIDDLNKTNICKEYPVKNNNLTKFKDKRILSKFRGLLRKIIIKNQLSNRLYIPKLINGIQLKEVKNYISEFNKINNKSLDIPVKEIKKNLIQIN